MSEYPQRLHHATPGWVKNGSLFHIRIRAAFEQAGSLIDPKLAGDLLDAAKRYHESGHWWCELFLLMPDHLHALIRFPTDPGLAKVISSWKRGTARFQGVKWQENFFDHRIRDKAGANEKGHYIRRNPVVKGLCAHENDWRIGGAAPLRVERVELGVLPKASALGSARSTWGETQSR